MASGICYTQSGNKKKYEQDCVKGIRTFCWPSYTFTPKQDGVAVTTYLPIDGYYIEDINFFKYGLNYDNQYTPNGEMAYYGVGHDRSIRDNYHLVYGNIRDPEKREETITKRIEERTFSYNSYGCSSKNKEYYSTTYFIGEDKELFPGKKYVNTMSFVDNNMAAFGVEKFGLMTLYGEDFSTQNFKNHNYRYSFVFNLYPEVNLNLSYIDDFSNFKYNNININKNYPYKNFIYRIDINNNRVRYYYGKYRPTNYKNPYNDSRSGFINEISGISNPSYFIIRSNNLFKNKPVNDINKDYHHFAIIGFNNNYGRGASYTYYGELNGYDYYKYNKISYSLPNWTKTVNIDSRGWTYIYPPNYSGILTDIYSFSNDTNVTFVFSYFSMLAEYAI